MIVWRYSCITTDMATPTVTFSSLDRPVEPLIAPVEPKKVSSWWRSSTSEYPGKFEDRDREAKEITGTQEFFDGMRFDCQRGLSNNFSIAHIISMGSSEANGTYTFNANYATQKFNALGRYDGEGRVTGRVTYSPSSRFVATAQSSIALEPAASNLSLEMDYKGEDSHTSMKAENKGVLILSYMQGIYRTLSAGTELLHIPGQGTLLSATGRYTWPASKSPEEPVKNIANISLSTMRMVSASYTRRAGKKAEFATEVQGMVGQDGVLNTIWTAGFLYSFRNSRVKGRVDSQGRVGASVEEHITPFMRVCLVGDLDHREQKYKLGLGFSLML